MKAKIIERILITFGFKAVTFFVKLFKRKLDSNYLTYRIFKRFSFAPKLKDETHSIFLETIYRYEELYGKDIAKLFYSDITGNTFSNFEIYCKENKALPLKNWLENQVLNSKTLKKIDWLKINVEQEIEKFFEIYNSVCYEAQSHSQSHQTKILEGIKGYLNSNNWDLIFGFCEDYIKKLAPKSVLKTIEYLESSNELKRSENKNFLISKLLLYKAECYALLRDDSKVSKLNIQAYEHDSSNIAACSRVALIYAVQGNLNKSKQLYETVLEKDKLNKNAWLCQLILCERHELARFFESIPLTVKENPNFLLVAHGNLLSRFPDLDTSSYYDSSLIKNNIPDKVDSKNLYRHIYKLKNELMSLIESNDLFISLQSGIVTSNVTATKDSLERFLVQIEKTEISTFFEDYKCFLSFMKFLETKEKTHLDALRSSFEKSSDEWKSYLYDLLLNSVLAGNNPSEIVEVIDLIEQPSIQLLAFRLNYLYSLKNESQIIITANKIIQKSKESLQETFTILIDELFTLSSFGYFQKLEISKFQESGDRINIFGLPR